MRITSVELRPEGSSEVIELSFRDPSNQEPFQVQSITSLDADEITPQFYGTSGDSSKRYYNLTLKKREPVVLIGLNPRFGDVTESTYTELRDRLYRCIASSRTGVVAIHFKDGGVTNAAIKGTVMKFEAPLFTDRPQVQITFNCPEPMLKSVDRIQAIPSEFVSSSLVITESRSTAPSGVRMSVRFTTAEDRFVIYPEGVEHKLEVRPHGGFAIDDVLYFSSEPGNKYIYRTRGFNRTELADVVVSGSIWPLVFPGVNRFKIDPACRWLSADYYRTYWGV